MLDCEMGHFNPVHSRASCGRKSKNYWVLLWCVRTTVCALHFTYMKCMNNVPYLCPPLELHSVIPEGQEPYLRNYFTTLRSSYSYSFIIVYTLGETISEVSTGKNITFTDFLQTLISLGSLAFFPPSQCCICIFMLLIFFLKNQIEAAEPSIAAISHDVLRMLKMQCLLWVWTIVLHASCGPVGGIQKMSPDAFQENHKRPLFFPSFQHVICCGKETTRITQMGDNWNNPSILQVRWLVQFRCQNLWFLKNVYVWKLWSVTRNSRWKPN